MNSVDVTSCSHSQGWPMVRVTMSAVTDSEKPKHSTPHRIMSASSSQSSQRHFRWRWRCNTSLSAMAIATLVVPAKAGTHYPERELLRELATPSRRQTQSCGYG